MKTNSYSRPRAGDDNAYLEALFRTHKYSPEYPAFGFESLETAREWVHRFVQWYNEEHRHNELKHGTPARRHHGESVAIPAARKVVFEANRKHPERLKSRRRGILMRQK
ncbi:MAG: integrase core domain-containing protein [Aminivibrio sp.]